MTHNPEATEEVPSAVKDLADDLAERRALDGTRRTHAQLTRWHRARHRIALADARENAARARRSRRERARDAREQTALADLYRQASVSGARAQVRAQIMQSAEMRARRVSRVRTTSLLVLVPVLAGFGVWSTAGVHAGATEVLGLAAGTALWWAAWLLEPAIIAVVATLIVIRAVLRSSGGDLGWRGWVAEWVALSASIALNLAGAWPESGATLAGVGALVAHSAGPLGAAGTAWLLGVIDDAVASAKPYGKPGEAVPTLTELGVVRPEAKAIPDRPPVPPVEVPAQGERPGERVSAPAASASVEPRRLLGEADYERLLDPRPSEGAPVEPSAAERRERPASSADERRSIVAELLEQNPNLTGPEIAEAVGARLGQPVSVATAKRDRAAVQNGK